MSKRSIRKVRHYKQSLTFAQHVVLGQISGQLSRGEIMYDNIPDWMKTNELAVDWLPVPAQPLELDEPIILTSDAIHNESETEHIHGPSCHHNH